MKSFLSLVAFVAVSAAALGQQAPRVDDHFWRKRVVSNIDLAEKINKALVEKQSPNYVPGSDPRYGARTRGLVEAIIEGWRQGRYSAYKSDTLSRPVQFSWFEARLQKLNGGPVTATESGSTEGGDEGEDPDAIDSGEEEFGGDEFSGGDEAAAGEGDAEATGAGTIDLGNLEFVLQIVEDRIFDKGRSVMIHDIEFVRFVWVDAEAKQPDEAMVAFRYDDIVSVLDETQWKNKFNDSEDRTIREIFDQRLFNSYVIGYSQNTPGTLYEADKRRQQMIEFEHHLWSY